MKVNFSVGANKAVSVQVSPLGKYGLFVTVLELWVVVKTHKEKKRTLENKTETLQNTQFIFHFLNILWKYKKADLLHCFYAWSNTGLQQEKGHYRADTLMKIRLFFFNMFLWQIILKLHSWIYILIIVNQEHTQKKCSWKKPTSCSAPLRCIHW